MNLAPCKCGLQPKYVSKVVRSIFTLRVVCACGRHGAHLMFTKREDRIKIKQAACDGWNFGA